MSQQHEVLLVKVNETIVEQRGVLREVATMLRDAGLDAEDQIVMKAIRELEAQIHPMDMVRKAMLLLRPVLARLREIGTPSVLPITVKLKRSCSALSQRHDQVLTETQQLDPEDLP